jgi:DNA-binding NarL/FixJ family response regulator
MFGDPSDSAWQRWIDAGIIPPPIKIGERQRGVSLWAEDELIACQDRMLAAREARVIERSQRPPEEIYADIKLEPAPAAPEPPPLTPAKAAQQARDRRIAGLQAKGWSRKDIARECGVSVERVRQILTRIEAGARDREIA